MNRQKQQTMEAEAIRNALSGEDKDFIKFLKDWVDDIPANRKKLREAIKEKNTLSKEIKDLQSKKQKVGPERTRRFKELKKQIEDLAPLVNMPEPEYVAKNYDWM